MIYKCCSVFNVLLYYYILCICKTKVVNLTPALAQSQQLTLEMHNITISIVIEFLFALMTSSYYIAMGMAIK